MATLRKFAVIIICYCLVTVQLLRKDLLGKSPSNFAVAPLLSKGPTALVSDVLLDADVSALKTYREQWIATHCIYTRTRSRHERGRFKNVVGILRSLALLICFAFGLVSTGVASLSCVINFVSTIPHLVPAMVAWLLIGLIMPEPDEIHILLTSIKKFTLSTHNGVFEHVHRVNLVFESLTTVTEKLLHYSYTVCNRAVIAMLLLRAGDVERNPGPMDGITVSKQPTKWAMIPEENKAADNKGVGPSRDLYLIQEGVKTLKLTLPDNDPFKALQNDDSSSERDEALDHETTAPESGLDRNAHRPVTCDPQPATTTTDAVQPESNDKERHNYVTVKKSGGYTIRRYSTSIVPETYTTAKDKKELVKEAIQMWKEKSDPDRIACRMTLKLDEVCIKLFLNLMRIYRDNRTEEISSLKFCPLCYRESDSKLKNSHIIPKCILETFREIHVPVQSFNEQEDHRILYNFSKWSRFPPRKATVQLLCKDCEHRASAAEGRLRSVYLCVTSHPNTTCQIKDVQYKELHHILAQILFRGVLVNVDIDDYRDGEHWFMHEEFKTTFTRLWNYCGDINFANPPDMYLFLLPNCPYNDATTYSLFSMERILRSPHYTKLVRDKAGLYFYTKFDCFHIVVAINDESRKYFNTFQNGLYSHKDGPILLQCTRPRPKRQHQSQNGDSVLQYTPFTEEEMITHFPDVLIQWNIDFYHDYVDLILRQPKRANIVDYVIPFFGIRHRPDESDLNIRKEDKDNGLSRMQVDLGKEAKAAKKFNISKVDQNDYIMKSAESSPLHVVMVAKQEYKRVRELKAELMKEKEKNSVLLTRIDNELERYKKLESKHNELQDEIDFRRGSVVSLTIKLKNERKSRRELVKEQIQKLKFVFTKLSKKYSDPATTSFTNLRKEICDRLQDTATLNKHAQELGDDDLQRECDEVHQEYKQLQVSRSLSS